MVNSSNLARISMTILLFGEVWNEEAIDVKTKCIITVVSLMASGITDSSLFIICRMRRHMA